jgi:hypothetical protein
MTGETQLWSHRPTSRSTHGRAGGLCYFSFFETHAKIARSFECVSLTKLDATNRTSPPARRERRYSRYYVTVRYCTHTYYPTRRNESLFPHSRRFQHAMFLLDRRRLLARYRTMTGFKIIFFNFWYCSFDIEPPTER